MNVDLNEFFRQATIRICGNLDLQEAMSACLDYLGAFIPINSMNLRYFDPRLNVLKAIAVASRSGEENVMEVLPLPNRGMEERVQKWNDIPFIEVISQPSRHPDLAIMYPKSGMDLDCSLMVMPIKHNGQHVANLAVKARGNNRYTEEHVTLFKMLYEPFAIAVVNALRHQEMLQLKNALADDNRYLQRELRELVGDEIVGSGFGLRHIMEMVRQVAPLDSPVLLMGETGVGKGVIASAMHNLSSRRDGPFIKVDCGAIPDNLIDSELFGHEKGAFTGAVGQKRGRFERANKGTIFLDEIGEFPLQAQVRLLRVLQDHEIERVGGTSSIPVDVRIISATHRNLEAMVESGQFREDLWFRLNVFPIIVPPLRHRKTDIPALVQHLVEKKAKQCRLKNHPIFASGAMDRLVGYAWPGNVRELENVIERELILHGSGVMTFDGLSKHEERNSGGIDSALSGEDELLTLDDMTARYLRHALKICRGKISGPGGVAERLGIHPNTLRTKMNKLGISYKKKRTM